MSDGHPKTFINKQAVDKSCQKATKNKHEILEPDYNFLTEKKNSYKQKQNLSIHKSCKDQGSNSIENINPTVAMQKIGQNTKQQNCPGKCQQ
jgi:hypothetical protein